jgi:alkylhydroperoxidase/carboxymuconolactone decarboxylase family protein YurZ
MEHYLGVAKEEGITDQELGAVQSIVMAVSGGRAMMQFMEALARVRKKDDPVDPDCSGTCP